MRIEELERDLRAERPEPSLDFARRLDEWAESGFPRDRGLGPRHSSRRGPFQRAWDRLTAVPPRRILMPAGAVATLVVVAGVAISRDQGSEGGLGAGSPTEQVAPAPADTTSSAVAPGSAESAQELSAPPNSGFSSSSNDRIVDASASLALGADADDVQDVADGVVEVADRYHGVVLDSQVTTDRAGARASFQLEIPAGRLDAALADLSGLADVISRTEGSQDITAQAVRARRHLASTLDEIRKARVALIRADSREQKLVLRSQIDSLEANADAQRAAVDGVKRQGRFATVDVDVSSTSGAASDDGNWSLGDAADDAVNVLETIAGIALVSLAILLPVSLLAALLAFAVSRGRRRSREKALGD
jgi:hypothetical protein